MVRLRYVAVSIPLYKKITGEVKGTGFASVVGLSFIALYKLVY